MRLHRGWYDSQDMGYMDEDGYLWHVGRLARFLKIGGEMVSLPLVEDILQRALPPGVDGVVVEAPDAARGSRVVAVVTEGVDEREVLRRWAATWRTSPCETVCVVRVAEDASGKIDYRQLTKTMAASAARRRQPAGGRGRRATRSPSCSTCSVLVARTRRSRCPGRASTGSSKSMTASERAPAAREHRAWDVRLEWGCLRPT
jgi:hypothetical protein